MSIDASECEDYCGKRRELERELARLRADVAATAKSWEEERQGYRSDLRKLGEELATWRQLHLGLASQVLAIEEARHATKAGALAFKGPSWGSLVKLAKAKPRGSK